MKLVTTIAALIIALNTHVALTDELKIDGTTEETFATSTKAITDSLTAEEKEIFHNGIMNLILTRYSPAAGAEGLALLAFIPQAVEVAHVTMNGVTKSEILARGREIQARKEASKNPSTPAKPDYNAAKSCLQREVIVSNARIEKGDYGGEYIKLDVTNNLTWAVSFVHVGYKVITPGRSVPWSDESFGIDVSGGIEPGETREVSTNAFGIPAMATDISTTAEILDVADAEKRHLVGETKFIGHPEELSPLGCE